MSRVLMIVTVPPGHLNAVLEAMAGAGAGILGQYTHCSFAGEGVGRFKPSAGANPALGQREQLNAEAEVRVESFCDRSRASAVIQAIRAAHPYEEPVIHVLALLDAADL